MRKLWHEWIKSVLLIILVITSLRSAIADWNDVPTGSMKPTILEGDRIVVNKLAYDLKVPFTTWRIATWDNPQRGDIVVLYSPADGKRLVKRVVGGPGDTIAMYHNRLIVNGERVSYSPLDPELVEALELDMANRILAEEDLGTVTHTVLLTQHAPSRSSFGEIVVPADRYFVLGDNRDQSLDSRYFGFVRRSRIVGQATAVAASVDPEQSFSPRWGRFFQGLK
jgi:signal peptidase I